MLTFKGYTSVSMNILKTINIVNWLAEEYERGRPQMDMVMMEIYLPPGSRFLIVPSEESEFIQPHYCQFEILDAKICTRDITFIRMALVNHPTACTGAINRLL